MIAPFPYFGGKRTIAAQVWAALGQPVHYIEPFFGSGAVLLERPDDGQTKHMETVCDKDGHLANVWRSLRADPDEVARWCDWPINHADLSARRRRMIENMEDLLPQLIADETFYDAKMAGYWIWAASCWIGRGLTTPAKGAGVHKIGRIPHVGHGGEGVHKIGQRPHVIDGGKGVHKIGQIPHLTSKGTGVHKIGQIPHVDNGGKGVHGIGKRSWQGGCNPNIYQWFRELAERLRYVRVICGDWTRVCGGNWQAGVGLCGIFFDPPYGVTDRDQNIYAEESITVAHDVMLWAAERGTRPDHRIVIAGYEEHMPLVDEYGWSCESWKSVGGYAHLGKNRGTENCKREVLYYSPHCLKEQVPTQNELFE